MADQPPASTTPTRGEKKRKFDGGRRSPPPKIPIATADAYSRIASNPKGAAKSGRGSQAGWTHCPLCFPLSRKLFARGRGIAAHLHSVHTPWKEPGKIERKRRRLAPANNNGSSSTSSWEPTPQELEEWNRHVLQMVQELDDQPLLPDHSPADVVVDRNGNAPQEYRSSLPPFLEAAAKGNFTRLKQILDSKQNCREAMLDELNRTDRHLSIAEHWAAGGGHLDCLKWLVETRNRIETSGDNPVVANHHKLRRRDGKTALHYAARNGRVPCIDFLIRECGRAVDETCGDGSTPLHMACFGGHLNAMEILIHTHGANPLRPNDWGCTCAHWLAMTKCPSRDQVRQMCRLLQAAGVDFTEKQKQGHTALHKAAQRQNRHVIEWLAQATTTEDDRGAGLADHEKRELGLPDEGGHTPSDIWCHVGGDPSFGEWMKNEMGW